MFHLFRYEFKYIDKKTFAFSFEQLIMFFDISIFFHSFDIFILLCLRHSMLVISLNYLIIGIF